MTEEILPSGAGDSAIVDGVGGAVVITGETAGTLTIVKPGWRSASNIIHRTDLSAFATMDTGICIYLEFAVCDHVLIEIGSQHV